MRKDQPIIAQVQQRDRLLFYPYDSVEPFLRLLNEAVDSPQVLSIKITIYRLATSSKIAQALCRAAENGKEVLVLMEVKARFDEENNLAWSKMLEESGCQVIYGTEGFKCHSKVCLITLRRRGKTSYITQIGTGNYNEKTNAMYTDLSIMTANSVIGEDAASFFRNMLVNRLDGDYRELCVSPFGIKTMLLQNIDRQIAVPVYDKRLQEQVKWVLDAQLRDTAKASLMLSDGMYCRKHSAVPFDSQDDFMKQSPHIPAEPLKESPTFSQRLKHILAELISAILK